MIAAMKRRAFITLLSGAAAAWPVVTRAQQPDRMRRIGIMMNSAADDPEPQGHIAALRQGLQQLGWIEGSNVQFEVRWGGGSAEGYRRYAPEVVAFAPDVIVAAAVPSVAAIQALNRSIPI